jgi:GH24 family phage-related lysozyme (muramidase)
MIDSGPELTKNHEGYVEGIYLDSLGYPTMGYGTLLCKQKFVTVKEYLANCFMDKYREAEEAYAQIGLDLDDVRRSAVVDLIYNLGPAGFSKFKDTIAMLKMRDFGAAAICLEQSRWYKQVGRRGPRICSLIRTGRWDSLDKM